MIGRAVLPLAIALRAAAPVAAQEPALPAPVCELHVWPADAAKTFNTLKDIDWVTFADVNKYSRDASNPLGGTQASVELQLRVYGKLDLPGLLGLPGYAVILHDTPLESRVIRTTKGRHLPDRGPCYAELVTDDIFFQQQHLYDVKHIMRSQIISTFRFRRFDGAETPAFSYGSFIASDLFDPRKKQELTLELAITQFEAAFGNSVKDFTDAANAAALGKPRRKKGK